MLLKSGDRCWIMTNAIPVAVDKFENKFSSDSRPPAEAPIPTTKVGDTFVLPGILSLLGAVVLSSLSLVVTLRPSMS